MRWIRTLLALGIAIVTLACGGLGSGTAGTSGAAAGVSVGPYATSFAKHQGEKYPDAPSRTQAIGDEWDIDAGKWTVRVDKVTVVEAESALPWIQNVTERKRTKGKSLAIVEYALRNNLPVTSSALPNRSVYLPTGELALGGPYNERLFAKEHGIEKPPGKLPPNTWVPMLASATLDDPSDVEGAAMLFFSYTTEFDRDRRKDVRVRTETVVVELVGAVQGPHVNPEKR